MSSFADYVGAHGHDFAPATAGPLFRAAQQKSARPPASFVVVHYQAIHFGAQFHFNQRRNADVQPGDNSTLRRFRDEHGVLVGRLDFAQSLRNLCRFRRISQLAAELRDSNGIAALCAPDSDACLFGCGIGLFLFWRHGSTRILNLFSEVILIGQNILSESSKIVTGPSLTNSTDMVA